MQEFPDNQSELLEQRCCRSNDTVTGADGFAVEKSEGGKRIKTRTKRSDTGEKESLMMTNLVHDLFTRVPARV